MKGIDLTGQLFGRLTALYPSKVRYSKGGQSKTRWKCRCSCGDEVVVDTAALRRGTTRSCGCLNAENLLRRNTKHGMRSTPTYQSWLSMRNRCTNSKAINYHRYGGRGIKVSDRWMGSFELFLADMGERPEGMTLDREDNSLDYNRSNCRWATPKEQANNRG